MEGKGDGKKRNEEGRGGEGSGGVGLGKEGGGEGPEERRSRLDDDS